MKRVLLIAFHFPPLTGTSGVLRALKYAQYLPDFGWTPLVLSAHPRAYQVTSSEQLKELSADLVVKRAQAFDTSRHFSIRGWYPSVAAIPDRWISWCFGAIPAGLNLIRKHRPEIIWSTYPIATAHIIGMVLHRMTGLPWVADFRDPMAQEGYPADPLRWRAYRRIEEWALKHAARSTFTTRGAMRMYAQRYPSVDPNRLRVNANGYDEKSFASAEADDNVPRDGQRRVRLVHSGVVYPSERDPTNLFAAIASLLAKGTLSEDAIELVLRATGHDAHLAELISRFRLEAVVKLEPPVSYQKALREMVTADALLVLQASNCNDQVPAKVYEYLRAGRPILGLTDPRGDTAGVLRDAGIDTIAPLDSQEQIERTLLSFVDAVRSGKAPIPDAAVVRANSRHARTRELADILEEVRSSAT